MQHVLFHEGSAHTEGLGAKWREVKYGLWLTLRLQWLMRSSGNRDNKGNGKATATMKAMIA